MRRLNWVGITLGIMVIRLMMVPTVRAGNVKITPLGSHDGEFCRFDRALILEDPTGTRILYDAGRTVAGPSDPRLGSINVILVSHMHGDHVGDTHIATSIGGSNGCSGLPGVAGVVVTTAYTNSVEIACAKNAEIITGSEMPSFFANRLAAHGSCTGAASTLVRFGANITRGNVDITTVPAVHSNGINAAFLGDTLGPLLASYGLTAYAGPPTGYVLTFSNGLVVYLSGDTGITADQFTVVRDHYGAKLVVMNIGDTFTTGPTEAAYVINELIKPKSVIASHVNEDATVDGEVVGSKTATFIAASSVPVHIPLSGNTMEFDGSGKCVSGC